MSEDCVVDVEARTGYSLKVPTIFGTGRLTEGCRELYPSIFVPVLTQNPDRPKSRHHWTPNATATKACVRIIVAYLDFSLAAALFLG